MSTRHTTRLKALRSYFDAQAKQFKFSAPVAGWPNNDTLRQSKRPSKTWPAGDKNVRYVALPSGMCRVASA